jgi:DNA modification methylase
MHKYWGRKCHNVTNEYIKHFTNEGDVVLDPFMGSGVTVIEGVKLKRQVIGIDLNPITTLIAKNTIVKVDIAKLKTEFTRISSYIDEKFRDFYKTECSLCKNICYADNYIWENMSIVRVKHTCPQCGTVRNNSTEFDDQLFDNKVKLLNETKHNLNYPSNAMLKYVRRNGRTHIDQLFTERALIILSELYKSINAVPDNEVRDILKMCFTSMLPNVSRMIPGDKERVTGKSGWQISKFWVPSIHTEKNILESFKQRFNKILSGKLEVNNLNDSNAKIINASSEDLSFLDSNSVDYIFTDPPYGESINYFGLSMLWNAWLGLDVEYKNEIIYDTYREKDYQDYEYRMNNVFKELSRVLKTNKFLSFTFHNRDLKIWRIVLDCCRKNGFKLINIVYQPQAVSSGTQGINRKNTFNGDFIYNYCKVSQDELSFEKFNGDINELIIQTTKLLIMENNGVTPDKLFSELIPTLVNANALFEGNNENLDIDKILENYFIYVSAQINNKTIYKWQLPDVSKLNDYTSVLKDKAIVSEGEHVC